METKGSGKTNKLVRIFNSVRDIPYRIPLKYGEEELERTPHDKQCTHTYIEVKIGNKWKILQGMGNQLHKKGSSSAVYLSCHWCLPVCHRDTRTLAKRSRTRGCFYVFYPHAAVFQGSLDKACLSSKELQLKPLALARGYKENSKSSPVHGKLKVFQY